MTETTEETLTGAQIDSGVKLSMKSLAARLDGIEAAIEVVYSKTQESGSLDSQEADTFSDVILGVCEALRCAGINTAARMAEELEAKYYDTDDGEGGQTRNPVLDRFPWMVDYQ